MSKLNKKQIDSFAKSLMPELHKIQRRWNTWDKALDAYTILKNTRSQHVLEKVGFQYINEQDGLKHYIYVQ